MTQPMTDEMYRNLLSNDGASKSSSRRRGCQKELQKKDTFATFLRKSCKNCEGKTFFLFWGSKSLGAGFTKIFMKFKSDLNPSEVCTFSGSVWCFNSAWTSLLFSNSSLIEFKIFEFKHILRLRFMNFSSLSLSLERNFASFGWNISIISSLIEFKFLKNTIHRTQISLSLKTE